jgi:CRP/FNR family transcriptional regulator, cyclic AMP receptor protein
VATGKSGGKDAGSTGGQGEQSKPAGPARAAATTETPRRPAQPAQPSSARAAGATGAAASHITSLSQVQLFAGLDHEALRELATSMRHRAFRPGEIIVHRDDPGQVLYIIREGKVKIYITSPDGQEVSLAVFGPGDYFGELAMLDGQPRSASAVALEAVEAICLQRTDFINAVMRYPRIAIQVMYVLSRRLRQTDAMIEDLLFLDVHGRVAKKLLDLADLHGVRTPEGIRIELRLTQGELAAMVGASRESVNKVMGYFTDKQFISTDKYKITITRLAELRRRVY